MSAHKLATILAAEAVRGAGGDSNGSRKIIEGWVTTHKGRVLSITNAAVLAEMPDTASAVGERNSAVELLGAVGNCPAD